MDEKQDRETEIDLFEIGVNMAKKKRLYRYLLAAAVCVGVAAGLLWSAAGYMTGSSAYAQAVIALQYEGIENGLAPDGMALDINMIKSPVIIGAALDSLGDTETDVETVRENIVIEGVIPEDAVERITAIEQMAEKDASNYEKILDVSYFSSQYVVRLYRGFGQSPSEAKELLDAVLESYREWFINTYAETPAPNVVQDQEYGDYDYVQSVDIMQSQLDIMTDYVSERCEEAPDFRSPETGLTFENIKESLRIVEEVEMVNLSSYIEGNALTTDRQRLIEYYNYRIKKYSGDISRLQNEIGLLQGTIDAYEKDPLVIVSGQENMQTVGVKDEYYKTLIEEKMELSRQLADAGVKLDETTLLLKAALENDRKNTQAEYDTADRLRQSAAASIVKWNEALRDTARDYASLTYSNAVKTAVPAQYRAADGMLKKILICTVAAVAAVIVIWCLDGLRMELGRSRGKTVSVQS